MLISISIPYVLELAHKYANNDKNEFKKYLGNPSQQSAFLSRVTKDEIIDEIKNIKINKSPGQDEFTAKFLKLSENKK